MRKFISGFALQEPYYAWPPNRAVAADRNPRERGLRPLNSHR